MLLLTQTVKLSTVWRYHIEFRASEYKCQSKMETKVFQGSMDAGQQVELLRRQYLQLVDPGQLLLPSDPLLILPEVQAQIYTTMFQRASIIDMPPDRYRFRVLKRLIDRLEQAFQNPEDDVRLSLRYSHRNLLKVIILCDGNFISPFVFPFADDII